MFEKIKLVNGFSVTADLSQLASCRSCGKSILWAVTKNAKKMPICKDDNGNWISHFADCPSASKFRKPEDRLSEFDRQRERETWWQ